MICDYETLQSISKTVRKNILDIIYHSKSSHIGSCLSVVDILTVLYFENFIRLDPSNDCFHDKLILSKGHAAAALYATLHVRGVLSRSDLDSFGFYPSPLLGHVSHYVKGVEVSTGSLGHGLPIGAGIALAFKRCSAHQAVYVIASDGELNEGSSWEAIMFAGHHKLHNLTLIVDYNHIQSLGNVSEILNLEPLLDKFKAFGWDSYQIDGHDHEAITHTLRLVHGNPKVLIAHTIKGKGISFMEHELKWHYKNPNSEDYKQALLELSL